jgi:hypothetical protein
MSSKMEMLVPLGAFQLCQWTSTTAPYANSSYNSAGILHNKKVTTLLKEGIYDITTNIVDSEAFSAMMRTDTLTDI